MRYAGIIPNDIAAGEGVNVSFFVQGCPIHCPNCHNPQTWSFDGGKEFTPETLNHLVSLVNKNGVQRNFSILGGEPLCQENVFLTALVIKTIKEQYPEIKIYVWTGYTEEQLQKRTDNKLSYIFENIDYLIAGPYIDSERDITLPMCGSRNQKIINLKERKNNE